MERTFAELAVKEITPSPFNPRHDFDDEKFRELVVSVVKVGVLEPILVRPVDGDTPYELVAGERRWRACMTAAEQNGGIDHARIPAMIQEMDDDLALDVQTIENLQRKDLTGLEEAEAFRIFVDRKGKEAIPELAERTGINEQYIRRRLMVLDLPKKILKAWDRGDLRFGHLEQLARMNDRQQRMSIFDGLMKDRQYRPVTVADLKQRIARISPPLKSARFDTEACLTCTQNTGVQIRLFDLGDGDPCCNRPKCFKQKQAEHLTAHWKRTGFYRNRGTGGFRFDDEINYNDYEGFYGAGKPAKKCRSCEHHLTILHIDGSAALDRACFGKKSCYNAIQSARSKSTGNTDPGPDPKPGPRTAWHGEHFREVFFQEQLPIRFETMLAGSLTSRKLALYAMLKGNEKACDDFCLRHQVGKPLYDDGPMAMNRQQAFAAIAGMDMLEVDAEIKAAAVQSVLSHDYCTDERRFVAEHVGIDLSSEWRFTEAYLAKKTKGEMLAFGDRFGLFEDDMAKTFLSDTLNRKSFKACKKGELIRVFLESGADTAGMVPDEILGTDPDATP